MSFKQFQIVCAIFGSISIAVVLSQSGGIRIPATGFSCHGRPTGYYADMETGCQIYHMCDELGRKFSYSCPNTTLFQQRMLVCDHWYMVDCSNAANDYHANLLIGQRDKHFVTEEDMRRRTPRPDILSVPTNINYNEGLKEAESKFPVHPGNNIGGVADSISSVNNNGLDSGKNYRPPTSWSTGTAVRPNKNPQSNYNRPSNNNSKKPNIDLDNDNLTGEASQEPEPTFESTPADQDFKQNIVISTQSTPSVDLQPPPIPTTTESSSDEFDIDVRMRKSEDSVVQFINRFDPNSPDTLNTTRTKTEILNINEQLPAGQSSAEEERTPRKNNNFGNFNTVQDGGKRIDTNSRFDKVNIKPILSIEPTLNFDSLQGSIDIQKLTTKQEPEIKTSIPTEATLLPEKSSKVPEPDKDLTPPKTDYAHHTLTTMGPPIYYEWKWGAPSVDLELPKDDNVTFEFSELPSNPGKRPFSVLPKTSTTEAATPLPSNVEYNISSYFVPDYVFPLDKPHPGYDSNDTESSFRVKVGPGSISFRENPDCPQCHPAYVKPGTCEPCIVQR